ncbi:hypothetical protein V3C99_008400 [Haemonchus contortus]
MAALGRVVLGRLPKSEGRSRLLERRKTKIAICAVNATSWLASSNLRYVLSSETCVENLMVQAMKIKYDVIGLSKTRRHRLLHAVLEIAEALFLRACDSKGAGGVDFLIPTLLGMNSFSFFSVFLFGLRCLCTNIKLRWRGVKSASYGSGEALRREPCLLKITVGDFNAMNGLGERLTSSTLDSRKAME